MSRPPSPRVRNRLRRGGPAGLAACGSGSGSGPTNSAAEFVDSFTSPDGQQAFAEVGFPPAP